LARTAAKIAETVRAAISAAREKEY